MEQPLWERPVLRKAAGRTLRPGGFELTDRAANRMGLLPGWRVLDVGCGLGATVNRLRSRYGALAFGVEPCPGQLDAAQETGLIRAQGHCLPFGPNSFHALFCECVLSLLPDAAQGLGEFHCVLRPGGFLALSDLCAPDADTAGNDCAARAVPLAETHGLVKAAGFEVLLLEDHSHRLRELAARLLFSSGENDVPCSCNRRGLGYYLMIAKKRG